MVGVVKLINPRRGMVAVQTDDGDFTVFEILGSHELTLGDKITGALGSLGGETLYNQSRREKFEAYIEAIQATPLNAKQLVS